MAGNKASHFCGKHNSLPPVSVPYPHPKTASRTRRQRNKLPSHLYGAKKAWKTRAGRYGQNLYHDIFLNFGRYDIIPISI